MIKLFGGVVVTGCVVVTRRSPTVRMFVTVTVPFAVRPMINGDLALAAVVKADVRAVVVVRVAVLTVPRLPTAGFAATVGEIVAPEVIVGVRRPLLLLITAAAGTAALLVVTFVVAAVAAAVVGVSVVAAVVGVVVTLLVSALATLPAGTVACVV